ncbi:MAG: N-acetyltransferase family protein [Pseudomonadota bacterium]
MFDPTIVRPATLNDLPVVQAIYANAVKSSAATWDETVPSLDAVRKKFQQLNSAGYPYLVAQGQSAPGSGEQNFTETLTTKAPADIVGFAYAGPFHHQSGWRYTAEHSIYVSQDQHGQGIGRTLLAALMDELRHKGFRTLIAGVSRPGAEASLAFHKAMGFVECGVLPNTGFKDGQWLDVVYLTYDFGVPTDMRRRQ